MHCVYQCVRIDSHNVVAIFLEAVDNDCTQTRECIMKKCLFAVQEDCFVKLSIDCLLNESVYEYVNERDLTLFVFNEEKTADEFIIVYKERFAHLDFEVVIDEADDAIRESFVNHVAYLLTDVNNFIEA